MLFRPGFTGFLGGWMGLLCQQSDIKWYFFLNEDTKWYFFLNEDIIVWSWNSSSDQVTTRLAYNSITTSSLQPRDKWWLRKKWKWSISPKLIYFIWLSLENHILTCNNLLRTGFNGPNVCCLWLSGSETVNHIFSSVIILELYGIMEWSPCITQHSGFWSYLFPQVMPTLVISQDG